MKEHISLVNVAGFGEIDCKRETVLVRFDVAEHIKQYFKGEYKWWLAIEVTVGFFLSRPLRI